MTTYNVAFTINVTDEDALIAYAKERVRACWQDSLETMTSGGESLVERAVLEAILFSSENPSPDEWGVEFLDAEIQEVRP